MLLRLRVILILLRLVMSLLSLLMLRLLGLSLFVRVLLGFGIILFFVWMILYAIDTYNFLAVPFLLLFVGGYYWAGFSTLWEEYRSKVAFDRAQAAITSKQIAERMKISPNTVKAFLRIVMVKMDVSTRSGIVGKIIGSVPERESRHPSSN